ncbi:MULTISPECIES: histidinol-phosphate transaminase [Corallincola]|uniref:Histidinol-phosphate aminotransferase n=2 Tax=Corallincola TaxID=1775176 RepID=A0ABY1WTF9_9GAMM|nr:MULTISPECIES: histidinol-phosphate transaminase [Corallincola]TAA48029.1 histidinol-phosphate transaminase [Corallincola spongiicola]TCI03316.1 histidinol-phosphate transaminase [Corallincola luteus]
MSCDLIALANAGIRGLHPYQAGKPVSELERELGISNVVKLASNENPLGISDKVKQALVSEFTELSRYPDANGFYLKEKLASRLGVESAQITLGNGSNDVLELIARTFVSAEHEVMFAEHAFVVYPLVTQAIGAKPCVVPAKAYGHDLDAMAAAISDKTKMIFIANPNNPTGTFLSKECLKAFIAAVPKDVIVVLDEAYDEYVDASDRANSVEWLNDYPNLVVTRTFSKAYGLAGLRVGYSVSSADMAGLLNRLRQPFNVNSLALKAAEVALDDNEFLHESVSVNRQGMTQLTDFFRQQQINFIPSWGNFVTFDTGRNGTDVYDALLHQGVIVRPIGGYGLPNHLRVSIGTSEENNRFIDALTSVLSL